MDNIGVVNLKWISLSVLVLQNAGLALTMRYSRKSTDNEELYLSSSAVVLSELFKLLVSMFVCFRYDCNSSLVAFIKLMRIECIDNVFEFSKLLIPSGLYVIQNNLVIVASSNLPVALCQVLIQMKIVTTAVFSELMLGKLHTTAQRLSVLCLAGGVALVQLSQSTASLQQGGQNYIVGVVAIFISCLTSGFAGVYFEKVLKTSTTSVWVRNIQMSLIGFVLATFLCFTNDFDVVFGSDGFFRGYNQTVWCVVWLSAAGGLLVAMVVKYADNILKGFATSISIILSCIVSALYFKETDITVLFVLGALVVCASAMIYGSMPLVAPSTSSTIHNSSPVAARSRLRSDSLKSSSDNV